MVEIIPNWHPVFVHFTIALLSLSAVFFLLAQIMQSSPQQTSWLNYARWNLWLGTLFAILTAIAGWFAYNSVTHDTPSHAAMTDHRNWALVTVAVFIGIAAWAYVLYRGKVKPNLVFLVLILVGSVLLTSTGWRGGELVYRYGLGVMSLPRADEHEHPGADHGHDSSHTHDTADEQMHEHDSISNSEHQDSHEHDTLSSPESQDTHVSPETSDHHDDGHNHTH